LNRDGVADANQAVVKGDVLSDDELDRMCWFVEGTYELPAPTNVDYKSLTPALVPHGPAIVGGTSTLGSSAGERKKYGDVIDYLRGIGEDPAHVMSCARD
jgi:hypothetical protein